MLYGQGYLKSTIVKNKDDALKNEKKKIRKKIMRMKTNGIKKHVQCFVIQLVS
jgi:hypothetical protein